MSDLVLSLLLALAGLFAGSFASMGVHRLADPNVKLYDPGPRCPQCLASLGIGEQIPLVSWLRQGRRCRHCDDSITWVYPAVEIVTAALWALAALRFGVSWELPAVLLLSWALVVASVTDLYVYLIPNRLTYRVLGISLIYMVAVELTTGADGPHLSAALLSMVVYFVLLFVPWLVYPQGMGFGDVRLALPMGLHIGFVADGRIHAVRAVFIALVIGCLLGVAGGLILRLLHRKGIEVLVDPLTMDDPEQANGNGMGPDAYVDEWGDPPEGEHSSAVADSVESVTVDTERRSADDTATTDDTEDTAEDTAAPAGFPFGPALAVGCLAVILYMDVLAPAI